MAHEVADRVYRLGAELVNWYIIEDGGRLTVVDAGNPNQYEQLPAALAPVLGPFNTTNNLSVDESFGRSILR